jgi:hypothetical protein
MKNADNYYILQSYIFEYPLRIYKCNIENFRKYIHNVLLLFSQNKLTIQDAELYKMLFHVDISQFIGREIENPVHFNLRNIKNGDLIGNYTSLFNGCLNADDSIWAHSFGDIYPKNVKKNIHRMIRDIFKTITKLNYYTINDVKLKLHK